MVHPLAWHCLQLWAGALVLGLALGSDDDVVVKQEDEAGPVGSVSFRLGSGAVATGLTMDWTAPMKTTLLKSERSPAGRR